MKKTNKLLVLMLALAMAMAMMSGCGSKQEEAPVSDSELTGLKIGACVMDLSNEYFSDSVKGYKQWIENHPGNDLDVVDGQGSVARQVEAIENFISEGVDCILLNSLDDQATQDVVKKAEEAGIKVMQYPDADYVSVGLCNDDYNFGYLQGQEAAKWITEKLNGEATVMFEWNPGNAALVERYNGQVAGITENCDMSKVTLLEPQSTNTAAECATLAENTLTAHPECKVFICSGDSPACSIAEAIKAKGVDTSDIFICGVDGAEEAFNMIRDGSYGYRCSIAYSLRTPDIAYDLIDNIARAAKGQDYAKKYYQEVIVVTADNIDEYTSMEPSFEDRFENYYNVWKEKDAANN